MARQVLAKLLGQIRGAATGGNGVSDAQLLERFTAAGDEAAFELLVRRHARLVLGVCRRTLHDEHAAEDAFQAAFLALARKAASISRREAVVSWLYRVAYRAALSLHAQRARDAARTQPIDAAANVPSPPEAVPSAERRELRAVLDEEVGRLPAKLRAPVVLCYLEGKTVAEAAGQLGCPHGTVASRLARARQRLRRRLSRKGLAPALLPGAGAAAPEVLVRSAIRTALGGAGAVPARVAAVTERVLRAMFLRKLLAGALVLTALAGAFVGGRLLVPVPAGAAAQAEPPEEKAPAKPAAVTVSRPVKRMRAPFQDFLGRLEAGQVVLVRAQVSGPLLKVCFKDGAEVKKGDLLFEIDPRPLKAEVDQAEANLAVARAKIDLARADLRNAQKLAEQKVVSREEVESRVIKVSLAESEYKAAQARLELARLTLDQTQVRAPMDGTIGRHLVDPGNLVTGSGPGATLLATLSSLDPIGVVFDMAERSFLTYGQLVREGQVKGEGGPLRVGLFGEEGIPHEGTLVSFDDRADPQTGTIRARGILPNPGRRMLPGMSARVRIPFGKPRRVLEVPEAAVGSDQGKHFVWVVNERNVVDRREVKVGPVDGQMRIIEAGLGADDGVVIRGMAGLKAGDKVEPRRAKPKAPGDD